MYRKTKGGRKFHLTFPSGLNVYKFFICIRSLASFLQRPFCLGEGSFPKNRLSGATNIVIICRTNKKSGSFSAISLSFNLFIFSKIAYLYNLKYEKVAFVADSVSEIFRFRIFLENAGGWRSEDFNAGFFRLGRNCIAEGFGVRDRSSRGLFHGGISFFPMSGSPDIPCGERGADGGGRIGRRMRRPVQDIDRLCDSGAVRTRDPQLRRLLLYPTELRNRFCQGSKLA